MLSFLPNIILGCLSLILYLFNTLFWLIPIILFSFMKALLPFSAWQKLFSTLLDAMASNWVAVNTGIQNLLTNTQFKVSGVEDLTPEGWYLVVSNHQSWVDILVLQRLLHNKIPFLKFFLKKELIYVPFLGIAWWALDFPFMKRYSKEFLAKNPHLKGKDIETTRKACNKFKHKPVSVMNFLEGTRFTPVKHQKQHSPFNNLLKPRAGGIAFVLDAMGEHLNKMVNVTIYYPEGIPTFFDFISGKVKTIHVAVETSEINAEMIGDYFNNNDFQQSFQKRVNQLWLDKDAKLTQLAKQKY